MRLALRTKTGSRVALSVWLHADRRIEVVKLDNEEYQSWVDAGSPGEFPGRPAPDALPLFAQGGIPALDTIDGYPRRGDAWEETVDGERVLRIATADAYDFQYESAVASDPEGGKVSEESRLFIASRGNRIITPYDESRLLDFDIEAQPREQIVVPSRRLVPNSRSVTYDASAATAGTTSSSAISLSLAVATNSDRHLTAFSSHVVFGVTLNSVSRNGDALTFRNGVNSPAQKRAEFWDQVAPDQGTFSTTWTFSANTDARVGLVSTYGVDQTNPRQGASTNSGASTTPTGTVTSASGNMVLGMVHIQGPAPTLTQDTDFTELWNVPGSFDPVHGAGRIAGDTSITKDDTLSASASWATILVSLAAASSERTADLDKTLDAATIAADTDLAIQADVAKTLDAATLETDTDVAVQADVAKTLDAATIAADADLSISVESENTLGAATASSSATLEIVADLGKSTEDSTLVSAASVPVTATLDVTLGAATLSSDVNTGAQIEADADITLESATLSADGTVTQPAAETVAGGSGVVRSRRRRRTRTPSFTVFETIRPPDPIVARATITLADATLVARATVGELLPERRRRIAFAGLVAGH